MSEPLNPLDKLFRDKLEDRTFPVDLDHWKDASKLIDQNQKKRRGLFWIFGAIGILLIGTVMFGISNLALLSKDKLTNTKTDRDQIKNSIKSETSKTNLTDAAGINTAEPNDRDQKNLTIVNQRISEINSSSELRISQEEGGNSNSLLATNKNYQKQNGSNLDYRQQEQLANLKNQNPKQNPNAQDILTKSIAPDIESHQIGMNEDSNFSSSLNSIEEQDRGSIKWPTDYLPSNIVLPTSKLITELSKTEFLTFENVDPELENQPRLKMGFYLEGLLNPLNTNQESFAGFRIGLIAKYLLTTSLSLQFEPGYHQYAGLRMYSKIRQDNIYDFGLSQEIYGMKAKTAHYLALPISLNYKFKKHQIELGVDLNYLLGVQGNVQQVILENISDEPGLTRNAQVSEVVESLSTGWLDMTPFAGFSSRYFLGYNYLVNRGFILGARAYFQPNSILEAAPEQLQKLSHTKLLIGVQAKFIIE